MITPSLRAMSVGAAHPVHVLPGQGEDHVDRVNLRQRDDAGAVGRHHVAGIDLTDTGQPLDRRAHRGVVQLHLGIAHIGLVGLHRGLELAHRVLLVLQVLTGNELLAAEIPVALERAACRGQLGLVLLFLGQRLVVLGLIGARVDLRQHLPLLHLLPFGERQLQQLTAHLRHHGHLVVRLHGAVGGQIHGHVALRDENGGHRHGSGALAIVAGSTRTSGARRRAILCRAMSSHDHDQCDHCHGSDGDPRDFPTRHELKTPYMAAMTIMDARIRTCVAPAAGVAPTTRSPTATVGRAESDQADSAMVEYIA